MSNRRSDNFKPVSHVVQGNGCSATCDGRGTSNYFYHVNALASDDITTYPVAAQTTCPNTDGTGALTTTYSYTWRVVDNVVTGSMASQTVTRPAVSAGHNGSGQAISETTVYDSAGRAVWRKDAEGFLSYSEYDAVTGALVKSIADVKISLGGYSNLPSGWTTPAGGGLHLVTMYELDGLGRTIAVTGPDNVTSYTVYLDYERQDGDAWILNETRSYPAWDPVTNHPTGPTIIRREIIWNDPASNDVARYSESLSISAAPGVTSSRPNGGESFVMADIQSLSREYYNLGGQVTHGDVYHSRQDLTYSTGISRSRRGSGIVTGVSAAEVAALH